MAHTLSTSQAEARKLYKLGPFRSVYQVILAKQGLNSETFPVLKNKYRITF